MYAALWTYQVPANLDEETIREQYERVVPNYLGVPGLVRKYFGFTEDAQEVIGIYLWESRDAADGFYTQEWIDGVTERWGAMPTKQGWVVPIVAETIAGHVVTDETLDLAPVEVS